MADMTGQVALVTGGIRGIGLAICKRLTNRGITVGGRDDHAQQFAGKYADHGVSIHQGNIGSNDDSVRVIRRGPGPARQLDILVNNAGITVDKTVRKMAPQEWDHVIDVNLSGAFYLSKVILQHMLMVSSGGPPPTACAARTLAVDRLCRSQGGPLPGWTTRERSGPCLPARIGEARLSQGDGSRRARPYGWHKHADPDRLANTWRRQGTSCIVAGERIYGGGL